MVLTPINKAMRPEQLSTLQAAPCLTVTCCLDMLSFQQWLFAAVCLLIDPRENGKQFFRVQFRVNTGPFSYSTGRKVSHIFTWRYDLFCCHFLQYDSVDFDYSDKESSQANVFHPVQSSPQ